MKKYPILNIIIKVLLAVVIVMLIVILTTQTTTKFPGKNEVPHDLIALV